MSRLYIFISHVDTIDKQDVYRYRSQNNIG